jgi:tripartite-type tricarboxylate transporter receptor subunit TctC
MNLPRHLSRRAVTAGLLSLIPLQRAAAAAELPRRIVLVVAFGAGSGIDFAGRLIADKLSKRLGLPVVVENRPGAGGMTGAEYVAHAQPDGGTLLLMDSATVVQKWLHKDVPFDVLTDFAPVAKMTNSTLLLCAQASFQCNSIKELVALARAEPGKLSAGTSGIGSPHHLDLLLFNSLAHINIVNVTYHSSLAAVNDLLGGQIPLAWSGLTAVGGHLRAGTLKALGSASEHRDPNAPSVPTFAEQGVPGVVVNNWFGIAAPAKTPSDVVAKLSKELAVVAEDPDFGERLKTGAFLPTYLDPTQFRAEIRDDSERFGELIRHAGIVPQ